MKKTEIYYRLQFTDKYMQKYANSIDEFTQKNTSMALLVDVKKIVQDLINTYYARSINIPSQKEFNLKAIINNKITRYIK